MRVLITGGAGFIGSRIGRGLLDQGHQVVVLDDLSTGFAEQAPTGAELVKGDIGDPHAVRAAIAGADVVLHHAARRAVLRSVEDPLDTDRVNTAGTLHVLQAARDAGASRVVIASSSSVYGGQGDAPARESDAPRPKSPYAVSKLAGEHYARVFAELYGLETVVLRYFNVYGPGQRPDAPYAAVIPLFIRALLAGETPLVEGDGLQSRDFTFVDDVVTANLLALRAPAHQAQGHVYNIARGRAASVLDLLRELCAITGAPFAPAFAPARPGDVRRSLAGVERARAHLGFHAQTGLAEGLRQTVEWFRESSAVTRPPG